MIHPRLLASQELALHRVNVQQQAFVPHLTGVDSVSCSNNVSTAVSSSGSNGAIQRTQSFRGESASSLVSTGLGSTTAVAAASVPPKKAGTPSLGQTLSGGGANSTAPASIARPEVRVLPEWFSSLEELDPFVLPIYQLRGSEPVTQRRRVTVHYISDQYDRLWLARRLTAMPSLSSSATAVTTKGKTGKIESPILSPQNATSSPLSSLSRHNISLTLFEDLITAFEIGSYCNPEIPVQRQSVSSFDSVVATGADAAVVEEVRQYWLGKRQALGGNVPCIPTLRMNVREDNQSTLCHNDLLQYCPLPFNRRDWSVAVVQRRIPQSLQWEAEDDVNNDEISPSRGRKSKRREVENLTNDEETGGEAASERELRKLLSSGWKVSRAILEREEWRLAHTHLALYELALLRHLAVASRDAPESGITSSISTNFTPWASDDALQEEWVGDDEVVEDFHYGMSNRAATAALESVMAIGRRL